MRSRALLGLMLLWCGVRTSRGLEVLWGGGVSSQPAFDTKFRWPGLVDHLDVQLLRSRGM